MLCGNTYHSSARNDRYTVTGSSFVLTRNPQSCCSLTKSRKPRDKAIYNKTRAIKSNDVVRTCIARLAAATDTANNIRAMFANQHTSHGMRKSHARYHSCSNQLHWSFFFTGKNTWIVLALLLLMFVWTVEDRFNRKDMFGFRRSGRPYLQSIVRVGRAESRHSSEQQQYYFCLTYAKIVHLSLHRKRLGFASIHSIALRCILTSQCTCQSI